MLSKFGLHSASSVLRFVIGISLLSIAQIAGAFSCYEPSFFNRVANTPVVFVARVTAGELVKTVDQHFEVQVSFEVLEQLKGDLDFEYLTTSAYYEMGSGIPFIVGGEYLVYAAEDGRTGMCQDSKLLTPAGFDGTKTAAKYELAAWRLVARNGFRNITAPWLMYEFDTGVDQVICDLRHEVQFDGARSHEKIPNGWIEMRKFIRLAAESSIVESWPLTTRLGLGRGGGVADHIATLIIGGTNFSFSPAKPRNGNPPEYFELDSRQAGELLELLGSESEIEIRIDHPKYGKLVGNTNTTTMSTALDDMKSCIQRQVR